VTREVVLDAEFLGKGKDPWGNQRYGFHAETRINRKDFGMAWNEILEAGGFLVGEEVHILLDIEALPS
jgi:polyisoprenoid-binding protein YceI